MALVNSEPGKCKKCGKYGFFQHVNHKQTQPYCKLCEPIIEQDAIDHAISVLKSKGVTPDIYEAFYKKYIVNREKE